MDEADDRDALHAGDVIAERYRVVRLLGRGGMGAVYEAENTWTTRRVAIKVLLPSLSGDNRAVARFQGEAQAATRLQHPNIVDVLDMGKDPKSGAVFIVQEFLRGEDLHAHLEKRRQLAPAEAAEVMVPVMSALAVAHERGIIHRDIKPENIFLVGSSKELTPKLIDFGLAKVLGEDASARKTSTGTIMGTPYYMSPEQARGDRAVDARTDVWAVGAVLFELLTGNVPIDAPSANLIFVKLLTSPTPRLRDVMPEAPADVAGIVDKALQPDLALRYGSMREMLADVLVARGFQNPDRAGSLRERFARSLEHEPPPDAPTPVDAPTPTDHIANLPTQSASDPSRATRPVGGALPEPAVREAGTQESWQREKATSAVTPPRRRGPWIAAAALAVVGLGAGAVMLRGSQPADTAARAPAHATPVHAAVAAPPVATAAVAPPATADAGAPSAAVAPAAVALAAVAPAAESEPAGAEPSPRRHRRRSRRNTAHDALAPVGP